MRNLVKYVLENGGDIKPLIIDITLTNGTGIFNPTVLVKDKRVYVNIRHSQYTLYHSELNIHEHPFGPLLYLNPENDISLTTSNFIGELDPNTLNLKYINKIDTTKLDKPPLWEFVGLEDGRLVNINDKFYLIGVRRDTTTNGQGRMEYSEIDFGINYAKEVSRVRIPAPGLNNSYCEKNWMPIIGEDNYFVKWLNPVEIVKVDLDNVTCETFLLKDKSEFSWDQRGGGQVIPWKDGYLTLTHETNLYKSEAGRKNAQYTHKLSYWSKDWDLISCSNSFSFMDAQIEFACGLAEYNGDYLITFGYQDNASYVLRMKGDTLEGLLHVA